MSNNENLNEITNLTELFKKYLNLNPDYKESINYFLIKDLIKFREEDYLKKINIIEDYDEVIEEYFEELKSSLNEYSNNKKELIIKNLSDKMKKSRKSIEELDNYLDTLLKLRNKYKISNVIANQNDVDLVFVPAV